MASILERTMKRNAPRTSLQILEDLEDHSHHSFPIDCGTRKVKFLSHDHAKHEEHLNHPRKIHPTVDLDDNRAYEKWPVFTSFGNHHVDTRACPNGIVWVFLLVIFVLGALSLEAAYGDPDNGVAPNHELAGRYIAGAAAMTVILAVWVLLMGLADMGRKEQAQRDKGMQPTPLYEYGVGNVLYFKMLKFLVSVLFCVSIIALPSVMTFYQNSLQQSSSSRNAALTGTEQPVQSRASSEAMAGRSLGATFLARSTLGSLGTATPLCYRRSGIVVPGTQRLDFECPNGRMLLQDVWLGHPQGSCGCPSTATPSHGYAEGSCADGPVLTEPTLSQPCCSTQHALKPREQLPNTSAAAWKHVPFNLCYKVRKCTLWLDKTYFVGNAKRCERLVNGTNTSVCQNFTLLDGLDTSGSPLTLHVQGKCFQRKATLMHGGDSTKQDVINLVIGLDLVGTWLFLMLVLWLKSEQRREERHFDQVSIDVSDYSVAMPVLPSHKSSNVLVDELKPHLLKVLNSKSAKRHARRMRGKKAAAIDVQLAEIHFGFDDLKLLEMQKKQATLKQHVELCIHRLQCASSIHDMHTVPKADQAEGSAKPKGDNLAHGGHLPKEMRRIRKKIEKATADLKKQDDELLKLIESLDKDKSDSDIDRMAHCAFITFAEEEGKLRCLKEFPNAWWSEHKQHCGHVICPRCLKDKRLRGTALHFYDPPMPSDIKWENLVLNPVKRAFKIVLVSLLLVALVGISFSIIVAIRYQKQKWNSKYPAVTCQPSDVTKENVERTYREAGFKPTPILSCYCKKYLVSNAGAIISSVQVGDLSSLSSSLAIEFVTGNNTLGQPRKERLCQEWFLAESFSYLAMHFMAWTVLIINYIITHQAINMVKFIRFKHVSEELVHTALFSIICMGVNTILVPLFAHSNIPGFEKFGLDGDYGDFTVSWYNDVGTLMFIIMIYNLFVPHVHLLYEKPLMQARLILDRSCSHDTSLTHKLTQHDLDKLYLGPEHEIAARAAQALNMVFVGVVYSAAMPLMPVLATLNVIVLYITDKWAFLRVYRKPPAYDASLALFVSQQLQYAGWVHCICAIAMFTAPDIVQGEPAGSLRRAFVDGIATRTNIDVLQYSLFRRIFNAPWAVVLFAVFLVTFSIYLVLKEFIEDWILWFFRLLLCKRKADFEHNPPLLNVLPLETLNDILENPQAYLDNHHVVYDMTADELRQRIERQISRRHRRASAASEAGDDDFNPLDSKTLIGLPSYDRKVNPKYAYAVGEDADDVRAKIQAERNSLSSPESRRRRSSVKGDVEMGHVGSGGKRKSKRRSSRKGYTAVNGDDDGELVLPAPWEAHSDAESGHTYYYNTKSGETRWELPDKSERKKRRALKRKSRRIKGDDADARRAVVAARAGLDSDAITMPSNKVREGKKKLMI